jgi:hypothetical protein
MNQTRSLPTESPQSAGGGHTHINYLHPGWLGTSMLRQVLQAGWGSSGGGESYFFPFRVRVKKEAKD